MTASAAPFFLLLLLCFLSPKAVRPLGLGGLLCLADAVVLPRPFIVSADWIAFFVVMRLYFTPTASGFYVQALTFSGFILMSLVLYDVFLIFLVANVFTGQFMVMPNSSYFMIDLANYIGLVPAHFNQLVYLVIGVVAALMIAASSDPSEPQIVVGVFDKLMLGFALSASAVAMWQWIAQAAGLWFPAAFFHNELRPVAWRQGLAGVARVSGPFSEPSSLAAYLGPPLCFLAATRIDKPPALLRQVTIFSGLAALVVSTSTTAFAVLPVVILCMICAAVIRSLQVKKIEPFAKRERSGLMKTIVFVGIGTILGAAFGVYLVRHYNVLGVIQDALLYKDRGTSFESRMYANRLAVEAFTKTGGLGIGLGGHVASSMYLTVAACLGVWGVFVFSWFTIGGLAAPFRRRPPASPSATAALVEGRLAAAALFLGGVIVDGLSGGNVNIPFLWMSFGLLMALDAAAQKTGRGARRTAQGAWRVAAIGPGSAPVRRHFKGRS